MLAETTASRSSPSGTTTTKESGDPHGFAAGPMQKLSAYFTPALKAGAENLNFRVQVSGCRLLHSPCLPVKSQALPYRLVPFR
jgi:hypothetical protein